MHKKLSWGVKLVAWCAAYAGVWLYGSSVYVRVNHVTMLAAASAIKWWMVPAGVIMALYLSIDDDS